LWTGNSAGQSIQNSGLFQPDLVWIKPRNTASYGPKVFDSVRGVSNFMETYDTAGDSSLPTGVTSFNSDFTLSEIGSVRSAVSTVTSGCG
jgi:hypothetical protein